MKRASVVLLASILFIAVATSFAQMAPPAPELKKLDYFTGTWTMDGDVKPGPMGAGERIRGPPSMSGWTANILWFRKAVTVE